MLYQCKNKCCLEQYDIQEGEDLICKICNFELEQVFSLGSLLVSEGMVEQIKKHGADKVFKSINNFSNPLQRCSYRKHFLEALNIMKLKWEYDNGEKIK